MRTTTASVTATTGDMDVPPAVAELIEFIHPVTAGPRTTFTALEEFALCVAVVELGAVGRPPTVAQLLDYVSQFAALTGTATRLGNGRVTREWWRSFRDRWGVFVIRSAQRLSIAALGDKIKTDAIEFLQLVQGVIKEHGLTGARVWNADETGINPAESYKEQVRVHRWPLRVAAGRLPHPMCLWHRCEWCDVLGGAERADGRSAGCHE